MDLKENLDRLYERFNNRDHVHTDPIIFLYNYTDVRDREIVALLTACLAYGRVAQIQKSVSSVLARLGPSPRETLCRSSFNDLQQNHAGFVHRFARADHLVGLMWAVKKVVAKYGSLCECMTSGRNAGDSDILPALTRFVGEVIRSADHDPGHLVPLPERGSAGKRLHLFLRWMVRKDQVDPGGWEGIRPSELIIPVDVHMHRICTLLKFTEKKQANLKTALEITEHFKKFSPTDPVKYDFALTRLGIENLPIHHYFVLN